MHWDDKTGTQWNGEMAGLLIEEKRKGIGIPLF